MATSFSGGKSQREPPTMGKQLVNFITIHESIHAPKAILIQYWFLLAHLTQRVM
jgi:hypothetical protein